jgi:hypothetical protein
MLRQARFWLRWWAQQAKPIDAVALRGQLLALGEWLHDSDYVGHDVRPTYLPAAISTVPALAMLGWINLQRLTGEARYEARARACWQRLLDTQTDDGVWPFPYAFRRNPPGHVYACETLMTLRALLDYHKRLSADAETLVRVRAGVEYLLREVGHEGGVFWYSATDHIRVPNISSMAANVLARAGRLLGRDQWLALASELAGYCVAQQRADGAYPYEEGAPRVYIPYHALETWELTEANALLGDPLLAASTERALVYLGVALRAGYRSYDDDHDGRRQFLFKTPIWSAKAFLTMGELATARGHLLRAMRRHRAPGAPYYLYLLNRRRLGPLTITYPSLRSDYMRYNASCFEIGTRLLLALQEQAC